MELKAYLAARQDLVNRELDRVLPAGHGPGARVVEAMRYSLLGGGKRLRPILCLAAAEAVGGAGEQVLPVACALEMIHTYSLIHDDLPAMDDDDLRRGRPTCHKQFDEATAILAGDGLLTAAFLVLAEGARRQPTQAVIYSEVIHLIAQAAGHEGMVGGQMADLLAEGQPSSLEQVEAIHRLKTGALLTASVRAGALLGGGTPEQVAALSRYGEKFGLIFQITDDLLDVEGDTVEMGKPTGMDAVRQKATYPAVLGVAGAKTQAQRLVAEALADLSSLGDAATPLRELVRYLLVRRK
ncbi:MAG: polyprenyl synthetase family protein [Desulfobacca sp.]|uniref:polyprenyl synthetase family protein n=1 Tax=Desulfobacca sp. TaxID=2067990 RepID=UPI00404B6378